MADKMKTKILFCILTAFAKWCINFLMKFNFFTEEPKSEEQQVLEKFLSMSVRSSDKVFDEFAKLEGAKVFGTEPLKRFVYIPGTRDDRVLLVAHADTVWDKNWQPDLNQDEQALKYSGGQYFNKDRYSYCGIGADDRAGCAILYLLKNSGHSLLILDGEEHGQLGAHFLQDNYPEIFEEINQHQYALQFDRQGNSDFKCYDIPVCSEFKQHIKSTLNLRDAGKKSRTDIVVLCKNMCGANLSVGYYDEHTSCERLCYKDWLKIYQKTAKMLKNKQKRYEILQKNENNENFEM